MPKDERQAVQTLPPFNSAPCVRKPVSGRHPPQALMQKIEDSVIVIMCLQDYSATVTSASFASYGCSTCTCTLQPTDISHLSALRGWCFRNRVAGELCEICNLNPYTSDRRVSGRSKMHISIRSEQIKFVLDLGFKRCIARTTAVKDT